VERYSSALRAELAMFVFRLSRSITSCCASEILSRSSASKARVLSSYETEYRRGYAPLQGSCEKLFLEDLCMFRNLPLNKRMAGSGNCINYRTCRNISDSNMRLPIWRELICSDPTNETIQCFFQLRVSMHCMG
jgi:hypothetical protein